MFKVNHEALHSYSGVRVRMRVLGCCYFTSVSTEQANLNTFWQWQMSAFAPNILYLPSFSKSCVSVLKKSHLIWNMCVSAICGANWSWPTIGPKPSALWVSLIYSMLHSLFYTSTLKLLFFLFSTQQIKQLNPKVFFNKSNSSLRF